MSNVQQIHLKKSATPGRIYKEKNINYIGQLDGSLKPEQLLSGDVSGSTLENKVKKVDFMTSGSTPFMIHNAEMAIKQQIEFITYLNNNW